MRSDWGLETRAGSRGSHFGRLSNSTLCFPLLSFAKRIGASALYTLGEQLGEAVSSSCTSSATVPLKLRYYMATCPATAGLVDARPSTAWPVVLAAPHGGRAAPASIPDRTSGCLEPDWNSAELAEAVWHAFRERDGGEAAWGGAPALVMLRLSREKLDGNRPRASACEEAADAQAAWDEYHGDLAQCLEDCVAAFGFCLLLDIHGQSHRAGLCAPLSLAVVLLDIRPVIFAYISL